MAGDWIKMRSDLAEDPAVIDMAAALDVDEDLIVGKLHRLWSWADRQSRDGHATGVTDVWIDRYIRCAGFAKAMVSVGWLVIEDRAVTFPNFDRHNGETAKTRALGAKRKQKQRSTVSGGVTPPVPDMSRSERDKSETREEKRREDQEPPSSPPADAAGPPRRKSERITFATFVAACRDQGQKPIQAGDPIFTFADDALIPREFIALAWRAFSAKHRAGRKQQAGIVGWRAHFRDAVRGNWGKLWYFPTEGAEAALTTVGVALKREAEAAAARKAETSHDGTEAAA